jgi:hypothetical protein
LPTVCNFIKRSLEARIWGFTLVKSYKTQYCFYQTVVVVFVCIYTLSD